MEMHDPRGKGEPLQIRLSLEEIKVIILQKYKWKNKKRKRK